MLQFIRSKAGSFLVKVLFVALIASFGVWGIGDFLRQRPQDNSIITVGSRSITGDELQRSVQRAMRQFGGRLTLEQARAMGIVEQTVQGEVARALFDQEASNQDIVVSDRQIVQTIEQDRNFAGPNGMFDRVKMLNVLAGNSMSESQYEAILRTELPRRIAVGPAVTGAETPTTLADLLYRLRNEKRVVDWIYLPNAGVLDTAEPDPTQLKTYYDKHPATFTAPEYRGFTALVLTDAAVAADVTVTDKQIEDSYQQRVDEFTKVEKRHVLQLLVPDQKAADDAEQQIAAGKDFMDVGKTVAKLDPSTIDLGTVAKSELPPAVGDVAFAAKQGDASKPVQGPFGWVIVKVTAIEPGGIKTLDEVKPQIEEALKKEAEANALYELSNKVQDAISAGAEIAQIGQQFKLTPFTVPAIDEEGKTPDGKPLAGLTVPTADVVRNVFETAQGQLGSMQEVPDNGGFFVVRVDSITPSVLKPIDQVKDQVADAWKGDQRAAKIADQAKALVDAIKPDAPLSKLAADRKIQVTTSPAFTRGNENRDVTLPAPLIAKMFELKQGETTSAAGPQGEYVAQLKEIKPAEPATSKDAVDQLSQQLKDTIGYELIDQFEGALKQRIPVAVHQAQIDKLFAPATE